MSEAKKGPAAEIREGFVKIAIWERQGSKGVFFTAGKPELSYKDGEGKWHNDAGSYDGFNLIDLAAAALRTRSKIRELVRAASPDDPETSEG